MMEPRVSFIVPCYNYGRYVTQAVDSLLSQTFQALEVIVIDDASSDDTPRVLERYREDPRVRIVRHATNLGYVRTANEGLTLARGELVGLLDADDYCLSPHAVSRQLAIFDAHPKVGYVHTGYALVDEHGVTSHINQPASEDRVRGGLEEFAELVQMNYVHHGGTLRRRECHTMLGGYSLELPHGFACDWDLWLRIATRYDVGYAAEPLYAYRIHGNNMTQGGVPAALAINELVTVIDRNIARLPASNDVRARWGAIRRQAVYLTVWGDLAHGRPRRAWQGLAAMLHRSPLMLADRVFISACARTLMISVLGASRYRRMYGGFGT